MTTLNAIRLRQIVLAFLCATSLLWVASSCADEPSAANFLRFQSVADGRCQTLSMGGQLRILANRHQSRAINFRLVRVFGKAHRQGRAVGTAAAGGEAVHLGCTLVDGRPQDWLLERASFTP